MKLKQMLAKYMGRVGLTLNAIVLEVDAAGHAALPEFQRGWYDPDAAKPGTFKLNPAKVEVEDVTGLKRTVEATRAEVRAAKVAQENAVKEALKAFEGIDPEKVRAMMTKLGTDEEQALIAAGQIDKVIEKRMEKQRAALLKEVEAANGKAAGAMEVASTFMERVLDNHVRAAAAKAGLHPSAVDDALLHARRLFSLNDDGEAVQFVKDSETEVVMGKDGKTPYSPAEWLESMKESKPHWFPAGASGGGSGGGKGGGGGPNLSGLSPTARLTAARAAGAGKK